MNALKANRIAVYFSMVFIVLLFAVSSKAKIDPTTIAGMWLFDEDEGDVAEDSSGNDNHGALTNGPKWDDGKFGTALEFNGSAAYVNCGNGPTLDITEELTVVAWVKFEGVDYKNGSGNLFTIASKGNPDSLAPTAGWWFSHDNRGNGQSFNYTCFGNENGGWSGGGNNFSGQSFQFTNGEWYNLAITVGDSIAKLYIDGTQLGADKPFSNLVLSDTGRDLTIGSTGTSYHFSGLIDEFAIFNVELEEGDILDIANNGLEKTASPMAVDLSGKITTTWANIKTR